MNVGNRSIVSTPHRNSGVGFQPERVLQRLDGTEQFNGLAFCDHGRSVSLLTVEVNTLTVAECKFHDMPTNKPKTRAEIARLRAKFASPKAAADAIGCSRPTVINWENGTDMRRSEFLRAAARVYQVRPEWLTSESDDDGYPWVADTKPPRIHAYEVRAVDGLDGLDDAQDVLVDEIDVMLSGGPGNYVPEFVETKFRMPFQVEWFRKHRVKPDNVKLMRVNGHSMERTLFDGDRVAVNFADVRIRDGKVYAIAIGGEAKIKRVFNQRDGGYRIVSDNADKDVYPDEIVPGDEKNTVSVLGRAIDRSGSGGL